MTRPPDRGPRGRPDGSEPPTVAFPVIGSSPVIASGPPLPTAKRRPRRPWIVGIPVVVLLVAVGMHGGAGSDVQRGFATGVSSVAGPTATVPAAVPVPAPTRVDVPVSTSWAMPDLVGAGLQDAQDAVQALTSDAIFFTASHDATGARRHQILDRDWKVCDQNVAPGATITASTRIDFGAVKLSERC